MRRSRAGGRGRWGRQAWAPRGSPGAAASAPATSATRAARLGDEEQNAASAGPGLNSCGHPGAGEPSAAASGMDQCVTVERELEKVLHKFSGYGQLCERGLEELIDYTGGLKHEILQSHGRTTGWARGAATRPPDASQAVAGQERYSGRVRPQPPARRGDPAGSCDFFSSSWLMCLEPAATSLSIKSEGKRSPTPNPGVAGSSHLTCVGQVRCACKLLPSRGGCPSPTPGPGVSRHPRGREVSELCWSQESG